MFWHLIAAVAAALAGAGIALVLRSLSGKRLPAWIIPVFAGLGMFGYTIYYEYTWFETSQARLPQGSVVISSEEGHMLWRPWTLLFPMPLAYTVLDNTSVQTQDVAQGRLARFILYRFEKQHLLSTVKSGKYQLLCNEKAMFRLNDAGEAKMETLTELETDAPLYQAICNRP
ncbi:hypothetical protein [Stutzerimonas stutzeri]|uniref:hypothetical protein n=1 Tax=Stutzerimonas stutzeri TaxID=316 RepID=UPI001BD05152|nr:hypothetical protein [Stutzerimonas stutzeri]